MAPAAPVHSRPAPWTASRHAESAFERAAPGARRALLRALPKVDLHCHLDGSLRVETLGELARGAGLALPEVPVGRLKQALGYGSRTASLADYLRLFELNLKVMQTPSALERIARELVQDCAKENVRYLEVRFCPFLHQEQGLTPDEVVQSVLKGLAKGERETGVRANLILSAMRHHPPERSVALAALAARYRGKGVVALDLAGDEAAHPPCLHAAAFEYARAHGLETTVHAGEAAGPRSVAQALDDCGAQRIGHGVRLAEDPALKERVRDLQVPVEMCPTSNAQTGAWRDLSTYPLQGFLDEGIRASIHTDNRLVSDTSSTQELEVAHGRCGLSLNALLAAIRNGFQSAFLPEAERQTLAAKAAQDAAALVARLAATPSPTGDSRPRSTPVARGRSQA